MSCYCPLQAWYAKDVSPNGKRRLTFNRSASLSGESIRVPCGQCIGCRLERSRQWALRCLHEKKMHAVSVFATLTYDDKHLPAGGTLVKRDLQLFMKRLRKAKGSSKENPLRFYACGEYGDLNRRPHYHALLFNCTFPDAKKYGETPAGFLLYESKELEEIWQNGKCMIGEVNFETAAYVARYVMKKVTGAEAVVHYEVFDSDGVVYDRLPEFTVMSRRPGIGAPYYDKYGQEVRDHDSVVVNAREVRPPRFYDTRTEKFDEARMRALKRKRRRMAVLSRLDNTVDRLRVKEVLTMKLLEQKRRML